MAYTNFCCRSGGSNLNAGTRTGNTTQPGQSADLTYAAGGWVNTTRVFTVASGDPVADGVAVDDYAAIDTGGSDAAYIARVTARTSTTITLASNGAGTNPANGTYTMRIGGAWSGPSGASDFPLDLNYTGAGILNTSADTARINLKDNQTYSITAAISMAAGPAVVQGYTTTYGDGGRASIDGGTTGASFVLININTGVQLRDLIIANNGDTGSANGVSFSNFTRVLVDRCVVHSVRGSGFAATSGQFTLVQCEVYAANQSNTANTPAVAITGTGLGALIRCMIHDNTGSNTDGARLGGGFGFLTCVDTVFDTNGRHGILAASTVNVTVVNCTFHGNGTDGILLLGNAPTL